MTQIISISNARSRLPDLVDQAKRSMARFIISKKGQPAAVLLGTEEYESWVETLEVMSNTKLIKSIKRGLEDIKRGRVVLWGKVVEKWNV